MVRIVAGFVFFILLSAITRPAAGTVTADPDSLALSQQALRSMILNQATPGMNEMSLQAAGRKRSIPLAFVLSAAVPGAGQVYNRQWIKAAASLALEALAINFYISSRNDGLDEEDAYKAYAHEHWSPARYAAWIEGYSDWLANVDRIEIDVPNIDFAHPEAWTSGERSQVHSFFDQIRAAEARLYHPETGATFSHKLPYFAEQQYYELIGKYFQFAPGWDDYGTWVDEDGNYISEVIDPERTGAGNTKPNVKGRFLEYAHNHAHAQDLLRRASRISALILVNHIVSAVDAAVSSKLHNDRLKTSVSLYRNPYGKAEPLLTIGYSF